MRNTYNRFLLLVCGLLLVLSHQPGFAQPWSPKDSTRVFQLLARGFSVAYENPDTAMKKIDSAVAISQQANYPFGLLKSLNIKGIIYDIKGDNDSALLNYRTALNMARQSDHQTEIGQISNNIGLIHWNQHKLDSALVYYKNAYDIFQKVDYPKGEANNLNNIGLIYYDLGEIDQSIKYHKKAIVVYNSIQDTFGLGAAYANIGYAHEDPDSAIRYFNKAIPLMEKARDSYGVSRAYNNLALAYQDKNDFEKSHEWLVKAAKNKIKIGEYYGLASTYQNIAHNFFYKFNEPDSAVKYSQMAGKIAEPRQYNRLLHKIWRMLFRVYKHQGNTDSALFYLEKGHEQYIEVFEKESDEKLRELQVKFDIAQKEAEIDQLSYQREVDALELKQKNTLLVSLGVGIFLLVISGTLYLFYLRNKRALAIQKAVTLEREKGLNAVIQATEDERKRIAKDLHDSVGQQLAALKLKFSKLRSAISSGASPSDDELTLYEDLIDNTNNEVRHISHEMMPRALQDKGLIAATEQMLENTLGQTEVKYRFEHYHINDRFEERVEVTVYRILQELVKNIIKHSQATETAIQIMHIKDKLVIIVEDNGVGIGENSGKEEGIGLLSMRSRVSDVHGEINYAPSPRSGTLVTIRIPVKG